VICTDGIDDACLLRQAVEEFATVAKSTAIELECEFTKVVLK